MLALKQQLRKTIALQIAALSPAEISAQSASVATQILAADWFKASRAVCVFLSMPKGEILTDALLYAIFASGKRCFVPRIEHLRTASATAVVTASASGGNGAAKAKAPVSPKAQASASGGKSKSPPSYMTMLECYGMSEVAAFPRNRWQIPEPPRTVTLTGTGTGSGTGNNNSNSVNSKSGDSKTPAIPLPLRADALNCADVDLVIVPGMAFGVLSDGSGRALRCGHGRGYYDRWFAALRERRVTTANTATGASTSATGASTSAVSSGKPSKGSGLPVPMPMPRLIGIGLSPQFLPPDQVPTDPHDVVLDGVVQPITLSAAAAMSTAATSGPVSK